LGILGINHIDLHSPDPVALREFYLSLLDAEPLNGYHDPLRVGSLQLAFHPLDPEATIGGAEIAFDADFAGYRDTLARATSMGALDGDEVRWNDHARSFYFVDPDGRRAEVSLHDPGVFWRA
jgi:hypothetical protein